MHELIKKNVLAFIKKEPVYFFTMTLIASIMFAFHSMIFSKNVQILCEQSAAMDFLLICATVVIVLVNGWLIHYIMKYILKQRSKEFAIYLSIGMKKKKIFIFYCKETCYQAIISWVIGLILGCFIKEILMDIYYHLFQVEYTFQIEMNFWCIVFSFFVYFMCYMIALIKIKKYFMKLSLSELMIENRKSELAINGKKSYLINKKIPLVLLKNNRLFLYRAVLSKYATMKKVLFTTVLLLSCSLVGSTIAMFYTDYQNHQIDREYPYSLMVYHDDIDLDFKGEKDILQKNHVQPESEHEYIIYRSMSEMNRIWLYTHLSYFQDLWEMNNGNINQKILDSNPDYDVYYPYDTYMKLSDYNKLRSMIGLPEKKLQKNGYILQVKHRLLNELTAEFTEKSILIGNQALQCTEICTDDFEQNGHNGADYIIVVSDEWMTELYPYYSVYTLQTTTCIPLEVSEKLRNLNAEIEYFKYGSNHNILYASPILTKTEIENNLKSTVSVVMFPFAYISLIFLCTTMAVLSIRLLSNSKEYQSQYEIFWKLGMKQSELNQLLHQQIALNYLFPLACAFGIGGCISFYLDRKLIYNVGLYVMDAKYLLLSLLWILIIYFVYYVLTDILFRRNVFLQLERGKS